MAKVSPPFSLVAHGLIPIRDSISRFVAGDFRDVGDLWNRLYHTSKRQSCELVASWNEPVGDGMLRRTKVRTMLQQSVLAVVAAELDARLTELYSRLRTWEDKACADVIGQIKSHREKSIESAKREDDVVVGMMSFDASVDAFLDQQIGDVIRGELRMEYEEIRSFAEETQQWLEPHIVFLGTLEDRRVDKDDNHEFRFIPNGDGYDIAGFGESERITAKGCKGLHDIFKLIQTPGSTVLYADLNGAGNDERIKIDSRSIQPAMDRQGREKAGREIRRLETELADAERDHNEAEQNELREKIDKLKQQVSNAVGIGGKSRDLNNPNNGKRQAVRDRLQTAYKAMRAARLNRIANHLDTSLAADGNNVGYIYSPGIEIRWQTEKQNGPK